MPRNLPGHFCPWRLVRKLFGFWGSTSTSFVGLQAPALSKYKGLRSSLLITFTNLIVLIRYIKESTYTIEPQSTPWVATTTPSIHNIPNIGIFECVSIPPSRLFCCFKFRIGICHWWRERRGIIVYKRTSHPSNIRATSQTNWEPWPWNCEGPKESVQRLSQNTSKIM